MKIEKTGKFTNLQSPDLPETIRNLKLDPDNEWTIDQLIELRKLELLSEISERLAVILDEHL